MYRPGPIFCAIAHRSQTDKGLEQLPSTLPPVYVYGNVQVGMEKHGKADVTDSVVFDQPSYITIDLTGDPHDGRPR